MSAPALVLLAAGASRRFGTPKQLEPLGPSGETIMELTARDAVAAGVERIVLVVNGETGSEVTAQMKEAARRDGYAAPVTIESVEQRLDDVPARVEQVPGRMRSSPAGPSRAGPSAKPPARVRPWGTAHALRTARLALADSGARIIVANADDWYGSTAIDRLVRSAAGTEGSGYAALVPYPIHVTLAPASVPDPRGVSRGVVEADEFGRLVGIREVLGLHRNPDDPHRARGRAADGSEVEISVEALCSMNLWAFGPEIWDVLDDHFRHFLVEHGSTSETECFLPDAVLGAVRRRRLSVRMLDPGTVHLGITHPTDLERVRDGLRTALRGRRGRPATLPSRPPED